MGLSITKNTKMYRTSRSSLPANDLTINTNENAISNDWMIFRISRVVVNNINPDVERNKYIAGVTNIPNKKSTAKIMRAIIMKIFAN